MNPILNRTALALASYRDRANSKTTWFIKPPTNSHFVPQTTFQALPKPPEILMSTLSNGKQITLKLNKIDNNFWGRFTSSSDQKSLDKECKKRGLRTDAHCFVAYDDDRGVSHKMILARQTDMLRIEYYIGTHKFPCHADEYLPPIWSKQKVEGSTTDIISNGNPLACKTLFLQGTELNSVIMQTCTTTKENGDDDGNSTHRHLYVEFSYSPS